MLRKAAIGSVSSDKYRVERAFWRDLIVDLAEWYRGDLPEYYETPSPTREQKVRCSTVDHSAVLTWFEMHQKPKYLTDLRLAPGVFSDMCVLDIGSGPMPSAEAFTKCELYCLDPLLHEYLKAGYPFHCYRASTKFVCGFSEAMPFEDDFFDAVIAVNAIDHVDDIFVTAKEMQRVLRPGGRLRMHVHYHDETTAEPMKLDDRAIRSAFAWCPELRKVRKSNVKMGARALSGESYNLWSNF